MFIFGDSFMAQSRDVSLKVLESKAEEISNYVANSKSVIDTIPLLPFSDLEKLLEAIAVRETKFSKHEIDVYQNKLNEIYERYKDENLDLDFRTKLQSEAFPNEDLFNKRKLDFQNTYAKVIKNNGNKEEVELAQQIFEKTALEFVTHQHLQDQLSQDIKFVRQCRKVKNLISQHYVALIPNLNVAAGSKVSLSNRFMKSETTLLRQKLLEKDLDPEPKKFSKPG
jgi:hypothetical protein